MSVMSVMKAAMLVVLGASGAAYADPLHAFPGVDIIETHNEAIYAHGGPPAKLDHMRVNLAVRDARTHTVAVTQLAVRTSCDAPDRQVLKLRGHELRSWDKNTVVAKGTARAVTPAKAAKYSLRIAFAEISTTTACRYELEIVVDGKRAQLELPLRITRESD